MALITKSIGTTARDYSTITLWEAALGGAAGGAGNDALGECYNDSVFDENPVINDTTPDSITLSVASGERHDGTAGSGARINSSTVPTSVIYGTSTKETIVEWLEVTAASGTDSLSSGGIAFSVSVGETFTARYNLVHDIDDACASGIAIQGADATNGANVFDNIVYRIRRTVNSSRDKFGIRAQTARPVGVYNNTVYGVAHTNALASGNATGIYVSDNAGKDNRNNIAMGTTVAGSGAANDFDPTSPSNTTAGYNMSSDATASDDGVTDNVLINKTSSDQFVSIAVGSEDLHLKNYSDAIDTATDLGTTPSGVEIDINGRDRDAQGDTWDIGAHEKVGGVPPSGGDGAGSRVASRAGSRFDNRFLERV